MSNAFSSRCPRRTGNTPPCVKTHCSGGLNICDLAMKRTERRSGSPTKKWSMCEKWLGAMITGPSGGTRSARIARARKKIHE